MHFAFLGSKEEKQTCGHPQVCFVLGIDQKIFISCKMAFSGPQ